MIWIYIFREKLRNTVTTKYASQNLLNGNYTSKTERLKCHSIVKGRHLESKSRIKGFLGRSFVTVNMTAVFWLKLTVSFQNKQDKKRAFSKGSSLQFLKIFLEHCNHQFLKLIKISETYRPIFSFLSILYLFLPHQRSSCVAWHRILEMRKLLYTF